MSVFEDATGRLAQLQFDSGETSLSVRSFVVEEAMSTLFRARVMARSLDVDLQLASLIGRGASLHIQGSPSHRRAWSGLCIDVRQARAEDSTEGLSTYELTIVPKLWLLTQRVNNRLFQHITIPEIADVLFKEWNLNPVWKIERDDHPRLELRTQYGETDYTFLCRLLEETGIAFYFPDGSGDLVLHDKPHTEGLWPGAPITAVDQPEQAMAGRQDYLTSVSLLEEARTGNVLLRDYDMRRPDYPLFSNKRAGPDHEHLYERYHYRPSGSRRELNAGLSGDEIATIASAAVDTLGATPVADELGVSRRVQSQGDTLAERALQAYRAGKRKVGFCTNVLELWPSQLFAMKGHPRMDLQPDHRLMTIALKTSGHVASAEPWEITGKAVFAAVPYRPPQRTEKPTIPGVHTAVVVGAAQPNGGSNEEIYVDELGRVRVQFPWDRQGEHTKQSSIWMRVSQGWAGGSYGMFTVPRVGHEVLVSFIDGDPDSPIITGRVHNAKTAVPFPLPDNKTVSTWRSQSSPGGGGSNEIRFDDAAGREHVYIQAQKNLDQLIKNDAKEAIGGDKNRYVQNDDGIGVGHDRCKFVNMNELEATGLNRTQFIGLNHTRAVGAEESTQVGTRWSVGIARGMTTQMVKELDRMASRLGGVMRGAATGVLGGIVGDPLAKMADAALTGFGRLAFDRLGETLNLKTAFATDPGPMSTMLEVVDRKITLTTGEASIVLDGPNITLTAQGVIATHSMGDTVCLAERELAVAGREKVALVSATDDVLVQAYRDVHLNPYEGSGDMEPARGLEGDPVGDAMRCGVCSAPLVRGPDGWSCPDELEMHSHEESPE